MRITPETLLNAPAQTQKTPASSGGRVFSLQAGNDRIDGSIPVWRSAESAQDKVIDNLANPGAAKTDVLSLNETPAPAGDQSFGFLDLVDMVNPLQHIPIVGTLYRALTGDQIKPISQIVGGAVFGGPLGAVSGVANAIVQEETGKDIGDTLLGMVTGGSSGHAPSDTTLAVANLSYQQPHYNE